MAASAERVPFRQTGGSVALDAIRGLAALLVLFDHCHNLFFLDYGSALRVSAHPHLTYVLYALSSAGAEAVVIFFVLSGYLISGSVFRALDQGRWSWKDYLTHRFVRLWLVLLPALVLCAAWDSGRLSLTGGTGSFLARMAAAGLTWKLFFGNVFFLQAAHTTTFGSDRALWSLAAEFWYYMLFPLGLLAIRRGTPVKARVLCGVGFLLAAGVAGRGIMGLFPVWLCGTALALVKPPKLGRAVRWVALALYAPCVFRLAMTPWPWRYFKMDYVLGAITAVFLWVLLSAAGRVDEKAFVVRASRSVAGSSYSLYLVHYPLLMFFAAVLTAGRKWAPTPRYLAMGAGFCVLAVLYSYGVAACTEWHNDRVREWVEARLGPRTGPRTRAREPLVAR
jgi:peptidoglycan/LPS O-acetylase OafA/YrhL